MATTIIPIKPKFNTPIEAPAMLSVVGEAIIPYNGSGNGLYLIAYSPDSGSFTIKAGDGIFAGSDMTVTVSAGSNNHILLEPAAFLQTTGEK